MDRYEELAALYKSALDTPHDRITLSDPNAWENWSNKVDQLFDHAIRNFMPDWDEMENIRRDTQELVDKKLINACDFTCVDQIRQLNPSLVIALLYKTCVTRDKFCLDSKRKSVDAICNVIIAALDKHYVRGRKFNDLMKRYFTEIGVTRQMT